MPLCVYRISAQAMSGVGSSNVGAGTEAGVQVQFSVAKLAYTRVTGTNGLCGEASANVTFTGKSVLYGVMG